jgi:hypothetical protein
MKDARAELSKLLKDMADLLNNAAYKIEEENYRGATNKEYRRDFIAAFDAREEIGMPKSGERRR